MNPTFEAVRQELKKYNAEDNEAPPKLVLANRDDFLNIEHKRKTNSQFILAVKEFCESEKFLIETMLGDLEKKSGRRPLIFMYNDRKVIETVIQDFEDFYNTPLDEDLFQKIGSSKGHGKIQFYLIIVVQEIYYYNS